MLKLRSEYILSLQYIKTGILTYNFTRWIRLYECSKFYRLLPRGGGWGGGKLLMKTSISIYNWWSARGVGKNYTNYDSLYTAFKARTLRAEHIPEKQRQHTNLWLKISLECTIFYTVLYIGYNIKSQLKERGE